jgi:prepilin-type N-terminal cleavage/methylation domain-containing protein
MKRAFTLLELIIVVAIIGLIAGVGSVFVREYGEQRNAGLTRQKVAAVKAGLLRVEKDEPVWYANGFVSDCGTFPPELATLLNKDGNATLIHADENNATQSGLLPKGLLMRDINSSGGRLMPAPFLDDDGHDSLDVNPRIGLYGGYAGPYAEVSLKDGWGREMEFNGGVAFPYSDGAIVSLLSAGADRRFDDEGASPVKAEFDEFLDTETEKAAYGGDIAEPLPQRAFRPESLEFDLSLDGNGSEYNRTAVIVYTPMLYYVEGTNCTFDDSMTDRYKKAVCDGGPQPWQRFAPGQMLPSDPVTYAVGVAKYVLTIDENNVTELYVNEPGVVGTSSSSLNASAFVRGFHITFEDEGGRDFVPADDTDDSFYLFGGEKSIVVLKEKKTSPTVWEVEDSFPWIFKPGRNEVIRNAR